MNEHITILIPYYCQPRMLEKQIEEWWRYDSKYKDRLTILIIDDGSPRKRALACIDVTRLPDLDIRLYEVKENLPWNTPGVFNLGFKEAPDGWVFLNGIDHVLRAEDLKQLMEKDLNAAHAYRPSRMHVQADGKEVAYKAPYGILLIRKEMFWRAGGYDEDFTGWYGNSSSLFQQSLKRHVTFVEMMDVCMYYYGRSAVEDAAVTDWGRKGSTRDVLLNEALVDKTMKVKREGYKPKNYLRFDWERIL